MYKDNWDKLTHLWNIKITDQVKKEVLTIGEDIFWKSYLIQDTFAKKHK